MQRAMFHMLSPCQYCEALPVTMLYSSSLGKSVELITILTSDAYYFVVQLEQGIHWTFDIISYEYEGIVNMIVAYNDHRCCKELYYLYKDGYIFCVTSEIYL